jgi:DnaA family protein
LAQLPLALRLDGAARFETFVAGGNAPAAAHVAAVARGERGDSVWLWGEPAAGKSHLLQAACRAADAGGRRAMYAALDPAAYGPELLADLEGVDLLALDELDRVAGRDVWERRLFSVLNGRLAAGAGLLLAARRPPGECGFALPDLASRAAGAAVYRLAALGDGERLEALLAHARCRALAIDAAAAAYLLTRVPRDMAQIALWLDRLDAASLAAQRKITIPLIRSVLANPSYD